ncbi:MAG: adenylate kinase [Candidatus Omnitrophica bacterium]|nr:adenylate kinase [Candidatus Omnitrophota bacterium]
MNTILLGPPGAGKGTLAAMLKDNFGLLHISTGDLLRDEMKGGTELGKTIKKYVESGELVPDQVVIAMIEKKLSEKNSGSKGYMLDGFPRTTVQAQDLDKILTKIGQPIDYALYMEASLPVILQRLTGRRVCRKCGAIVHIKNRPSKVAGVCDVCGGELYQRPDDTEETIKNRMHVYAEKTAPIVDYYAKQGKLETLSGDEETEDLLKIVAKIFNDGQRTDKIKGSTGH